MRAACGETFTLRSTLAKKPTHSSTMQTCEFLIKLYELYFQYLQSKTKHKYSSSEGKNRY